MEKQQNETRECELTAEELERASGGLRNNETEAWNTFKIAVVAGRIMGGGTIICI